jgi:hypothetical protein
MMPGEHMLWGFCFCLLTVMVFPQIGLFGLFIVFMSSIFIDIDHYIASVKAGNGWGVGKAYSWYMHPKNSTKDFVEKSFIPFHSIEFLILLAICAFGSYTISHILFIFFFSALLGCTFHLVLDLGFMISEKIKGEDQKMYIKISFIYSYFKNKSLLAKNHHYWRVNTR